MSKVVKSATKRATKRKTHFQIPYVIAQYSTRGEVTKLSVLEFPPIFESYKGKAYHFESARSRWLALCTLEPI